MENNKDSRLGEVSVGKLLFSLAVPAVLSQIVNVLYNIVDRIYIGHIPGEGVNALTGLGLCFPIIMLVGAFSSLFGMGGAPKAAIEMGKNDYKQAEKILGNAFTALLVTSAVLTTVLLIFGRRLLFVFGASDQTITYAWNYMQIYVCGTVFVQLALGLNMFITTQGFSKFSMFTVVIGAVLNIILDPIFIFGFKMGVRGAAIATIISQAVSSLWVILFLTGKKTHLKIRKENLRINKSVILPVMALGASPFVMQATESILNISFNSSLQKYGGDIAVGAMTIISSIIQLFIMPLQGLTQGAQPIISYNYGAKKMDRVKKAIKLQLIVCCSFTVICCILVELFPQIFISIFNNDPKLINITTWMMRLYMAGVFMFGAQVACQQSFIALGEAKISLFLACLRKLILLIPLIYIIPIFMENKVFGVMLAEPIADVTAATVTIILFATRIKKLIRKGQQEKTV